MVAATDSAPAWDVPRSSSGARTLVDTAKAHGVVEAACLHGTGLSAADLDDPEVLVQADQELGIIRNLIRETGNPPGLGLEAGRRFQLGTTGILGFALISSATVGEAMSVAVRYAALGSMFHTLALETDDEGAALVLGEEGTPADVRRFVLERDLGAIANVAPLLFGGALPKNVVRIEITLAPEADGPFASLSSLVPVRFGASRNAVVVANEMLDEPLSSADPRTARMCAQQCEDLLDQRRQRHGAAATVRSRLLQNPGAIPSMAEIADELHITTRALHRRLSLEGTSYRALVSEIRDTIAGELLAGGLTVHEVATRLGYAETASFTHAYTRWRGVPPVKHRRRIAQ